MFDRFAAHRPPTIRNLSPRTRRFTIGTAVVIPALLDLAMQLPNARYTDGYETVSFYQRLSAACAEHGQ